MIPRSEELLTETSATPQHSADPPRHDPQTQAPTFSHRHHQLNLRHPAACVQIPCEPGVVEVKDLEHVWCQIPPLASVAVHPVKRLLTEMGDGSTPTPGESPNSTTVIDSKCLPRQDDPKGDPTAQRPWEPETADFCAKKPLLRPLFRGRSCRGGVCLVSNRCNPNWSVSRNTFCGVGTKRTREKLVRTH